MPTIAATPALIDFVMTFAAWIHAVEGDRFYNAGADAELLKYRYLADHAGCVVTLETANSRMIHRVADYYGMERTEVRAIDSAFRMLCRELVGTPVPAIIPDDDWAEDYYRRQPKG